MNKYIIIGLVIVALIVGGIFWYRQSTPSPAPAGDEAAVRAVVEGFGKALQTVPLSGSKAAAAEAIKNNYAPFISSDILAFWEGDPAMAPGRRTSSPWPDRIEIIEMKHDDDGAYEVQGKIIEVTSVEVVSGGIAEEISVALKLRKQAAGWIITGFSWVGPQ